MEPLPLLRDLVAIDSVNPTLVPGAAGEGAIVSHLADALRRAGLDVTVQDAAPGRPNVIGLVEGGARGRTLMFCGHVDTVGVEGMQAPFSPVERDGRVYGRGAQDMKGGVAAMCAAAAAIAANGGLERGRLVVACVADEEWASLGAEALVRDWRADAAVVTEPTDLAIGIAHKGFAAIEARTRGIAAHGSRPRDGRDAIFRMGRVLAALEQLDRTLQAGPRHALLEGASVHASVIRGGQAWSIYPDACVLQLERRTLPGETADRPLGEVRSILEALHRADPEFDGDAQLVFGRPPYEIDARAELPQALARACEADGRPAPMVGLSFWTDAAILGGAGIPSVVFGPGGAGLHSAEEYVEIAQVEACARILRDLARDYLDG